MSVARVKVAGETFVYRNVENIRSDGQYIVLTLDAYPHKISHWQDRKTQFDFFVDDDEIIRFLREEINAR